MNTKKAALYIGAIWIVLFFLMALMTPAHYVETSQTAPGAIHVVSRGDINGGSLGALLLSAVRALFFTVIISILALVIGTIALGFKPFLIRIGLMKAETVRLTRICQHSSPLALLVLLP